ncbi:MAG: hypothetical protein EOO88_00500 [Pedobacter sp.]|nr:MAG: hypothetical protein EOO88_00500 [Pedobacter sp.]
MTRAFWVSVCLLFTAFSASAQEAVIMKKDSTGARLEKVDTLKTTYINPGKIAGRKAIFRSMIIPGWGQYGNGINLYRGIKIAAIYTGGTILVLSYISNNRQYNIYLKELRDRQANGGKPVIGSPYYNISGTTGIAAAKDTYRRNKDVIVFSMVGVYAIQVIEAYVDARLNYFDVGDDLTFRITPSIINSNTMFSYQSFTPAVKLSFRF